MYSVQPRSGLRLRITTLGALCIGVFIVMSVFLRLLTPVGDEPDYRIRLEQITNPELHPFWSSYHYLETSLAEIGADNGLTCDMQSSPFSLSASIDPETCTDSFNRIINRLLVIFSTVAPLFILSLITIQSTTRPRKLWLGAMATPVSTRATALALALCFPSVAYYLGLLSIEQLVLVLTLSSIVFWNSLVALTIILLLAASLDIGNASVFGFFVGFARAGIILDRKVGARLTVAILAVPVALALTLGFELVTIASSVPALEQSVNAIIESMSKSELLTKYPVILRPVITYMNFVFSTPANLKVPLAYLLVLMAIATTTVRVRRYATRLRAQSQFRELAALRTEVIIATAGLATILTFVVALPTYANAKYYMFLFPYFLLLPLRVHSKRKILVFALVLCVLVILQLLAFRWLS